MEEILHYEDGEALNRLLREAADAASLEVFKPRLDGALSKTWVWWKVSLFMAGGLELNYL